MVVAGGWGRGSGQLRFNGYGLSVGDDEKVLDVDGADHCKTM